ncbi:hypothetical protein KEM55_003177 [Ascosphaera atra]|nr:hypothetical protein KEM55_003177 [Ascosphaera atra]
MIQKEEARRGLKQSQLQAQAQPVLQPDMKGDSLTGLPTIAHVEDELAASEKDGATARDFATADSDVGDQPSPRNDADFSNTQTVHFDSDACAKSHPAATNYRELVQAETHR